MFKNKLIEQNKQNSNIQTINKNEDNIKRSNTQFLISKQKELNFIGKSTIINNRYFHDFISLTSVIELPKIDKLCQKMLIFFVLFWQVLKSSV